MNVMVLVKATKESEAGVLPTPELFEAMGRFTQALVNAGILLAADGLKPSAQGKRVRFSGSARTVTDGPFAETHELVAGFWLWQVRSIDEAREAFSRAASLTRNVRERELLLERVAAGERAGGAVN